MAKYRDRLQIIADMLSIVSEGARKTRIMYQANLSYKLLCRYLSEVLDAGLVAYNDEDCYVLTAKGEEFLSRYGEYSRLCKDLEEQLGLVNGEKSVLEKMCMNDDAVEGDVSNRGKEGLMKKKMSEE